MTPHIEQRLEVGQRKDEKGVHVRADQKHVLVDQGTGHLSILKVEFGDDIIGCMFDDLGVLVMTDQEPFVTYRIHMSILRVLSDDFRGLL